MNDVLDWLMECDEPWTCYRTRCDLLHLPVDDESVQTARAGMLAHPQLQNLIEVAMEWGASPLKRHNDASHPLYAISTLADFGIRADDPGMQGVLETVLAHQSEAGAFQTLLNIGQAYGGTGSDQWAWLACDAPTLLYSLLSFGLEGDPRVKSASAHLASLVTENGFLCAAAPELGKFRGPGRKTDPCPVANVYAIKALSLLPDGEDSQAAHAAAEVLLGHWEKRTEVKYYLFGMGSDFRRLKYPFVYYDILHVVEVLSRLPFTHRDPRFTEMLSVITAQAGEDGRYTAGSMYQAWKGWSFADKKLPSPWLTFLVLRILERCGRQGEGYSSGEEIHV